MPIDQLKEYLEKENIVYRVIEHDQAFTAQEAAAAADIPGRELAKTVMLNVDGKLAMAVLPAPERVNFEVLGSAIGAKEVRLADEYEFKDRFPDCEVGAMPPFGHLFGMDVYAADTLQDQVTIAFCAGSHEELVQICIDDFVRLVNPKILEFTWQP